MATLGNIQNAIIAVFQGIPGELGAVGQIGPRVSEVDFAKGV